MSRHPAALPDPTAADVPDVAEAPASSDPADPAVRLARTLQGPLERLGSGFMVSPETSALRTVLRLHGWEVYAGGRFGVLGDVDADVVSAAAVFFPAQRIRALWEAARAAAPPAELADHYARAAHAWARRRLAGFDGAERLARLLEPLVADASVAGAPLFAGWRALPLPEDPPARVVHLLHVLREHRGAMHALAVLASGLDPLQAVLAGPEGEEGARYFRWPAPYPVVDAAVRAAHRWAEARTDVLEAPLWARLGEHDGAGAWLLREADAHAARTAD